ncbi:MAG: hypothetical protein PHP37_03220 [Patescibacteria group bacterium]|nr:hypothetical protein [Patescibacteria group bacterium]
MRIIKWIARIIALILLIFGLLFYFGYGNPLPFVNPDYSLWENVALFMMPIIFIGLALGWKYEKIGAYLIIIPMLIVFLGGVAVHSNFSSNMLLPLIPGILYLIVGYKKK